MERARYVPPSRRGAASSDAAHRELRGLEGAYGTREPSQVRLVLLRDQGEPPDLSACPLDVEAQEGAQPPAWALFDPDRAPSELLRWFAAACADGAAQLQFPASLSKQERARWHHAADRVSGLHAQSMGVGDERHLTIGTAPLAAGSGGAGGGRQQPRLTAQQAQQAREIYDACQMEGGKHWERSRGEIEALVASGAPLPADLQEVVGRRLKGGQVCALLKSGRPSEALALLAEDSRLAWVKDQGSGGYPIHLAAWKGYESVVLYLASLPGCLEQRDGRRETALAVARRRRQAAIESLLLEAGANPDLASFQAGSGGGGGGGPAAAAAAEEEAEEEYMSWSRDERLSYRHGGARGGGSGSGRGGPPPGLHSSPSRGGGPGKRQQQEQPQRCPW